MLERGLQLILDTNAHLKDATGVRWLGWALLAALLFIPAVAAYVLLRRAEVRAGIEAERILATEERASTRKGQLAIGRAQEALHREADLKKIREQVLVKKIDTDAKYQAMTDRIDNAKSFRELKKIRDDMNKQ